MVSHRQPGPDERHILLVEDNPDDITLTLRAFHMNRLANRVEVVRDGEQALAYLFGRATYAARDLRDAPALVLLDLKLPKIDGLEVLRQLRADPRTRCQPVVILTSSQAERDLIEGYNLGANSYVRKPVDFNQFVQAARELELYWLMINEPPPR